MSDEQETVKELYVPQVGDVVMPHFSPRMFHRVVSVEETEFPPWFTEEQREQYGGKWYRLGIKMFMRMNGSLIKNAKSVSIANVANVTSAQEWLNIRIAALEKERTELMRLSTMVYNEQNKK